ncbi:MAG: ANTAR domain-containing protein [Thermoanaerobacteraceae bacterium]|nr:ANTAR domain-containing protein [Thermoanaerobacteraceae bacterium]
MFRTKVFVAVKDKTVLDKVKQILVRDGHQVVGEAEDGNTAIRLIRSTAPDLVIADADLPGLNGLEVAKIAYEDNVAPSVVLLSHWQREYIEREADPWLLAWLIKPVTETNLIASIGIALRNYERIQELEKEVAQLKEKIETRKLIERAKGILMETKQISESKAYNLIRKQSMNKCIPMRQVAEAIILAHDLES